MQASLRERLLRQHGTILWRALTPSDEYPWGGEVDCGDGWFDLLDVLCEQLQHHTDVDGAPQVFALRVKEKFGALRFQYAGGDDVHRAMADLACALSQRMCQSCGGPVPCSTCRPEDY